MLYILLLILGFSGGYFLKPTTKPNPVATIPVVENVEESKIPECSAGRCPQYFEMTVDKDWGPSASVVIVPTAMTQGEYDACG